MKGSKNKFPRNCEKESKTEGDRIKVFTSKKKSLKCWNNF